MASRKETGGYTRLEQPDFVILRLGELTLKGRNRSRFEQTALRHVREALGDLPKIEFTREFGRIYLQLNGEPYLIVAERLKRVFGLYSFSPVTRTELELVSIQEQALQAMRARPSPPQTFKVSVRRSNKQFPYPSQQMNDLVGGYILDAFPQLKVDLHHPQVELKIELRNEAAYIFSDVVKGLGGFPVGSNGKALLMLSGGIDSPVSGWLAMKRGLMLEAVHFHSYPYTSERARDKVIQLARKLTEYTPGIRLHLVPIADLQLKLHKANRGNLSITLLRRAMLRISEMLAQRSGLGAIVTGESLGQVASQTLPSLDATGRVVQLPLLRPLIFMDKQEIVDISEKIGTYPLSILPYEDCCTLFLPKSPSTNPNLGVIERIEAGLEWLDAAMLQAADQAETLVVTQHDKEEADALL
jgi:thiamine biosynthesis protein ThiI